jgi:hypothetical protein
MTTAHRMSGVDISQSARGMVRFFGDTAEREALARARKFEKSANQQGFSNRTAIARMIREGMHANRTEKDMSKVEGAAIGRALNTAR